MYYQNKNKELSINRYPKSESKSLKAWNAADEYILDYISKNNLSTQNLIIYNDRFGFLSSFFNYYSPIIIINSKSQIKSINHNITLNKLDIAKCSFITPLKELKLPSKLSIIKIPKSLELFRLYLNQVVDALDPDATVICGFMTKYFTPQMVDIANEFFEHTEQTLAWKKSRLLILTKPKQKKSISIINEISIDDTNLIKQYFGVFSSKKIDYATQFLIENINLRETDNVVLDLASGNGILAYTINKKQMDYDEIHLLDDSFLAIESSKLNLKGENIHHHYLDNLEKFEDNYFDFIVSNPPSHFEHETNIDISIALFKDVKRVLKMDGHFQLVASKHLNYKTHLIKIFKDVIITSENKKFTVYDCSL